MIKEVFWRLTQKVCKIQSREETWGQESGRRLVHSGVGCLSRGSSQRNEKYMRHQGKEELAGLGETGPNMVDIRDSCLGFKPF